MMSDEAYRAYTAAALDALEAAAPKRDVQTVYVDTGEQAMYCLSRPLDEKDVTAMKAGDWVTLCTYSSAAVLLRGRNGAMGDRALNYLRDTGAKVYVRADRIVKIAPLARSVAEGDVDLSAVDEAFWGADLPGGSSRLYCRAYRADPEGAEALREAYKTTGMAFAEYVDRLTDMAEPLEEETE